MNEQSQAVKGQSEVNQIGQFVQKFLPYWPLFVISVALSLAIAYIKLRAEMPMYVAYARIKLKDPAKGTDSKVLDQFNILSENKQVENEILVLKSTNLMQEVVRRLNVSVSVYNEGRVRIEELYKENAPVQFLPLRRDSVNYGGYQYFKVDWAKGEVDIEGQKVQFNGTAKIAGTEYKVVPTANYNKQLTGKNYFAEFNSLEGAAGSLAHSLAANPISLTSSVIDVNITTAVPEKGKDILSALFKVYNEYTVNQKNKAALRTLDFIEDRIVKVAEQLDSAETDFANYQSKNLVTDLSQQGGDYWSKQANFEEQQKSIELQLNLLSSVKKNVASGGTVPTLNGIDDGSLGGNIAAYQSALNTVNELRNTEGEKSELVIAARERVARAQKNVLDNIANVERALLARRGAYGNMMGISIGRLRSNPEKMKAFAAISRQKNLKDNIYNFLLEKREETQLNSASTIADMEEIESPSAYGPVSPLPKSFYTKWLMIGLLVPAAFVYLKDLLNRRVQLRHEIEQKTDVPIIAEIAQINTDSPVVIQEGKRTAVAEQFRALRTNLTFLGLTEKSNTIMVTSSASGEGKSFMAINLAVSFTLIGKKVALLELDLRKPKVSKLLSLRNDVGISNYLVNQASITDIIKPTTIKDLYVVPSGIIPPNPAELIQKDRFREMMTEIKERFDYVIIDTAPVGPVADSFLLKEYADATVFMVRQNRTQRGHLKMIEEINRKKRFKNLCIVFNGLKKRGLTYGSYGYGSYTYGDGDGYYVSDKAEGNIKVIGNRIKKMVGLKS